MASRIRRVRTLAVAIGLSTMFALLTVASAFADGGPGSWPH
jgi:hypothetical protein